MTTPHNIFFDGTGIEITPAIDRAIKRIINKTKRETVSDMFVIVASMDTKDRQFHRVAEIYATNNKIELSDD